MKKLSNILIGIRNSKLSKAQTNIFISEANKIDEIKKKFSFQIKTIKTSGDIHNNHRLDQLGGKGLFVKEIEEQVANNTVDLAVHSMKDLPAQESMEDLEIICWLERLTKDDVLISREGKNFLDLPSGSIIGTSSIRRRAQILKIRKDLSIKLLRGNIDTRIEKLNNNEYDAIILSKAGIDRLGLSNLITERLDHSNFLPAACQGAVGIQAKKKFKISKILKAINHEKTEIECLAERGVLKLINANCNSPVSVSANIENEKIKINCELLEHNGQQIFKKIVEGQKKKYSDLCKSLADDMLSNVGQKKINQLDILKDDFDYKAK